MRTMEFNCAMCRVQCDTAHAYAVHLKGMGHQRAVSQAEERARNRAEAEEKEAKAERFAQHWQPLLQPYYTRYEEAVQSTVGGIYSPRVAAAPPVTLSESVVQTYELARPRPHVVVRRKALYKFVFQVCRALFPEATLDVYGSIPHKLDSEGSDVDMSLSAQAGLDDAAVLNRVGRAVECCQSPYLVVTRVLHARIPVISIVDTLADRLQLDLSIDNIDKKHISTIFARYMELDDRLRPLIFCVRQWSKVRGINDAFSGYVNSFAWTVAVVCYLLGLGIVPVVDIDQDWTEGQWKPRDDGATPVGDLLVGFFVWFKEWDYRATRLSMRHGGVVPKEADRFEDYTYVCIERPRTPWQNITRQVEEGTWKQIRQELARAIRLLKAGSMFADVLDRRKQ